MKNKILIFDVELSGHHLEYLHHLLLKANNDLNEYVFYLPDNFNMVKGTDLDWSYNDNVVFAFFNSHVLDQHASFLKSSYHNCKLLKQAVKEFSATHIFLITLIRFIPFLPLLIPKSVKTSGIIYQIYLYRWKDSAFVQRILDVIKYLILSNSSVIDAIYILNDEVAVRRLSKLYNSKKYKFLVDPYVPLSCIDYGITRDKLEINDNAEVYLHMGDMRERKGTLDILKAILNLPQSELHRFHFIFAGKVNDEIKEDFYRLLAAMPQQIRITVFDEFCDYLFLGSLCTLSDYILMPYKQVGQSSGIIGYAAQFGKPVLAPDKGLVGKLVKRYNLGHTISEVSYLEIKNFILSPLKTRKVSQEYIMKNTVGNFLDSIVFV